MDWFIIEDLGNCFNGLFLRNSNYVIFNGNIVYKKGLLGKIIL